MTQKQIKLTHIFAIFAFLFLALTINIKAQTDEIKLLQPEQTIERELAGGQTHKYKFEAKANEFLQIKVEQKGIDVVVRLFDASGKQLAEMDSPNGTQGFENITFIISEAGNYTVEVGSLEANAAKGNYTILRETPRNAIEKDKKKLEAASLMNDALTLFIQGTADSIRVARGKFLEALLLYREISEKGGEAIAMHYAGLISQSLGENDTALKYYNQALSIFQSLNDKSWEAKVLNNLGLVYDYSGEKQQALELYEQVLAITKISGNKSDEAYAFNNIGKIYDDLGDRQKSLKYHNQALSLRRAIGDKRNEAYSLSNIGKVYSNLGENQEALKFYNEALSLIKVVEDKNAEALVLTSIGTVYSKLGDNQKALEFLSQALRFHKLTGNKLGEAYTLTNIGAVHSILGEWQKTLDFYNEALRLSRTVGDKHGEASMLSNIGMAYYELGDRQKALDFFNQSLALDRTIGNKTGEALALHNISLVYSDLGKKQEALKFYNQALLLHRAVGNKSGEAFTLHNIGKIYSELNDRQKALGVFDQSLHLFKSINDKRGEAMTLTTIGAYYGDLNDTQSALKFLNQALPLHRTVGNKYREAETLGSIMFVWEFLNIPRLAIFYGKQSINKYQEIRQNIKSLDKNLQKSFLGTIEKPYKKLADLLIAEGRISEAEQVLQMLKEEEVFDYLRRDASETDKLSQRADLTQQEKDALRRYEEIADKITALGKEFAELEKLGENRNAEQEKRFAELAAELEAANSSFQVFLRQLAEEFKKRTNTEKDLQENLALQSDLKKWGDDVVFIYTLVGEERFRTILVTPDTQADGKTEISAADLNKKITDFRAALQDVRVDPRLLGKELYDILIKPIEKQLDGAKAKTLLWSLDGNLRLLPLAALWDGQQYFGQKYENVTVTLASRTRLGDAVSKDWRVLGLGVSEGKTVKRPDGTRDVTFSPLFAVKEELASIVKSAPEETGVLDGQRLLNSEFTEDKLKKELPKGYKVVHIASHFSLNPGDATQSFLLLGDGTVLTVNEIKISPQLKFNGVELLTLSACQTAIVEKDSTGKEIEGFGYVAQQKGAEAILATLWNVADESTQIFMSEFYRLRKENPQMTKTEAIRRVQKAMITGEFQPQTEEGKQRSGVFGKTENKAQTFAYDAEKPFAHPYFWSPFVLIGNWK